MAILVVLKLDAQDAHRWTEAVERFAMADRRSAPFAWFCRSLGMGAFGRGAEALDLLGRPEVPEAADVLAARGMVELWLDEPAAAIGHLGVAFARARAGELVRVTQAIGFLSEAEYRLGRFAEAEVHGELAVQAAHDAGRVWDLPLLHALAAYPSAARGEFEAAESHVRAAEDWALLVPIPGFRGYAAHARVALALARGEGSLPMDAAITVEHTIEHLDPGFSSFGPVLAEALLGAGRLDEAADALDAFESRAAAAGRRSALLGGARLRGLLHALRGDHPGAEAHFRRGREIGAGLDLPLERARLTATHGRGLALAGRQVEARRAIEQAAAEFDALGARPYATAVRAQLASLGQGSLSHLGARLTASESVVARLVGEGLSNREIAERLVVSVKAVEYHLTNIYRQLGVSSRVRLARLVATDRPLEGID